MYVPFRKVYRAFGELKHLSDEECEKHLRRARLRQTRLWAAPWAAGVLAGAAWLGLIGAHLHARGELASITLESVVMDAGLLLAAVATTALAASFGGLLARDMVLLHLLRLEVHKARCPKCRQSLMGLPIVSRAIGPPVPGDARVRCTECGRVWVLVDIGLTPMDLVPWEMRGVPEDYGKIRRGAWR